jgi:transcriptional regulator with XRE-family HTH domain
MTSPGEWLRGLREELHLTRMAVERLTSEFARSANNERYRIRRGRLADIEDGKAVPDIFDAKSLSKCYKVTYRAILQAFGMSLEDSQNTPQGPTRSDETTNQWSFADTDRPFSLTFQSNISFDKTRLVTESAEELGVPAVVRQRLDAGQFRLGIIALNDDTMDDLVPGGSVVVIDKSHNTVEMGDWKTIQERPIYFVWHEKGYSCSWCHLVQDTLFIVPHPTSRRSVMIFKMPRAATIIGRIIHVWPPMILPKSPA